MSEHTDAILNEASSQQASNTFTASNGVILSFRKVNRLMAVEAANKVQMPVVPKVYVESKHRYEENPNDPDYIEKRNQAMFERGTIMANIYVALGTRIEHIPDGIQRPEDEDWYQDLVDLGIQISPRGNARYRAWLAYYALTESEYNDLTLAVMKWNGGITDEDVAKAQETFQDNSTRDTNK